MEKEMNYQESMDYIQKLTERAGSHYSITEMAALSEEAGRPERKLKIIHIAGTNGKGSVSNYISNILAMSGYTVGKYISPTILDYRERIQKVERQGDKPVSAYISEEMTAKQLTRLRSLCETLVDSGFSQPTAFEVETMMAFFTFLEWNVDYAVIETGLGGMMDATNIVEKPLQCIITSLSLEHQRILGDSMVKIAKEKYGILKKNAQVISAKQEGCFEILEEQVKRKKAVLYPVSEDDLKEVHFYDDHTSFTYRGIPFVLSQLGTYQVENALLAIESVLRLKEAGAENISEASIQAGIKESRWVGRFDIISKDPTIIADGAHNPDAAKRLAESLEVYFKGETLDFVFGVLTDKDYHSMAESLLPFMDHVYTVMPPVERGLSAEVLAKELEVLSGSGKSTVTVTACQTVEEAIRMAQDRTGGKKICVCGSLFLLGDLYHKNGETL